MKFRLTTEGNRYRIQRRVGWRILGYWSCVGGYPMTDDGFNRAVELVAKLQAQYDSGAIE